MHPIPCTIVLNEISKLEAKRRNSPWNLTDIQSNSSPAVRPLGEHVSRSRWTTWASWIRPLFNQEAQVVHLRFFLSFEALMLRQPLFPILHKTALSWSWRHMAIWSQIGVTQEVAAWDIKREGSMKNGKFRQNTEGKGLFNKVCSARSLLQHSLTFFFYLLF